MSESRRPTATRVDLPALALLERSLQLEQSFRHIIGVPNESFSRELEALREDPAGGGNLAEAIRARFRRLGGVALRLPARQAMREPPKPGR